MKRFSISLLLVLSAVLTGVAATTAPSTFVFTTLQGKPAPLADPLRQGPVLICMIKTWCPTSLDALKKCVVFQTAYADKTPHFHFLVVGQNKLPLLQKFVTDNGFGALTTVEEAPPFTASRSLGAQQTPTLVLLASDGTVLMRVSGWNRAKTNALSQKVAELTHLPYVAVSQAGDGMPETQPGCVIVDTPELEP